MFVSEVKKAQHGEHHSNILDSAEVDCLGLFNDEKPAQPGLSQEEKQAQQGNITAIFWTLQKCIV